MAGSAEVTFFHDSSFMVRMDKLLLVFDYCVGKNDPLPVATRLTERDMNDMEQILFFVSSGRTDHFDNVIYTFNYEKLPITYIVAEDVPLGNRGRRIREGETQVYGNVKVTAYPSTDVGVVFYVEADGTTILYAGDTNFWHWRDVCSVSEIRAAEKLFYEVIQPLEMLPIDIAMFPIDPRLGGMFAAGVDYFVMTVKPRILFPMHFAEKGDVVIDYARRGRTRYTEISALTRVREKAEV